MGERTRLGLGVIGVALVLGALGDVLLRATPWGINFLIWVTALVSFAVFLTRWGRAGTWGEGKMLVFVAVVFAAGVVLRDSPVVVFLGRRGSLGLQTARLAHVEPQPLDSQPTGQELRRRPGRTSTQDDPPRPIAPI